MRTLAFMHILVSLYLLGGSHGFIVFPHSRRANHYRWERKAIIESIDVLNSIPQLHNLQHAVPSHTVDALLNTMYWAPNNKRNFIQWLINRMYGVRAPDDPLLLANKSIPPASAQAGISKTNIENLPESLQAAIAKGWNFIDAQSIHAESVFPGFRQTGSILQQRIQHAPSEDSPETFAAIVQWSAGFLNVVDKLPYVALGYALFEFFVVRADLDWFKEDVEDAPAEVTMEAIGTTSVRFGALMVLSFLTVCFFN